MRIFISYTTINNDTTIELLNAISCRLRTIANVYIDLLDNDSDNKQKRVFDELDRSDLLILLISERIEQSKWVKIEIDRAQKMFIPILQFTINDLLECPILNLEIIFKRVVSGYNR
jgi:hypothetical protein